SAPRCRRTVPARPCLHRRDRRRCPRRQARSRRAGESRPGKPPPAAGGQARSRKSAGWNRVHEGSWFLLGSSLVVPAAARARRYHAKHGLKPPLRTLLYGGNIAHDAETDEAIRLAGLEPEAIGGAASPTLVEPAAAANHAEIMIVETRVHHALGR